MLQLFFLVMCAVYSLEGSIETVENRITQAAKESGTDEIVILRKGRLIYHYQSPQAPQRYDLKEMTGMFYSFAIGSLIDQKKILCLDVPVSSYIQGYPATTKLSAVLSHTSGLSKKEDFQILRKIIAVVSRKSVSDYISETFFIPMGIKDYSWVNESGYDSLMLRADDLAKVGWLLACGGEWHCKPLLSAGWIEILKKPSQQENPFFGQQIWLEHRDLAVYWDESLLNLYWKRGMKENFLCKLAGFDGREIHFGGSVVEGNILRLWGRELSPDCFQVVELITETHFLNLPLGHFTPGRLKSLIGWGAHGQQLVVMPDDQFVGVRLTAHSTNPFLDFTYEVDALTKEF